jgi:isoleucyl-tRNA synthetase
VVELSALQGHDDLVSVSYKANYRSLGKRFGPRTPHIAKAIENPHAWPVPNADDPSTYTIVVSEGDVEEAIVVGQDDFTRTERPAEGWAVASSGAETVALDLELTDELRAAGTVREIIRLVQDARKAQGFDVTDRIELWWEATGATEAALRGAAGLLAEEVLAVSVTEGAPAAPLHPHDVPERDVRFWLRVVD